MNIAALKSLAMPKLGENRRGERERVRKEWRARKHQADVERMREDKRRRAEVNRKRRRRSMEEKLRREFYDLASLQLPRTRLALFLLRNFTPYFRSSRLIWVQLFKPFNFYPAELV